MRFGIGMNTDHTLEEVGQQFSVTRERNPPDRGEGAAQAQASVAEQGRCGASSISRISGAKVRVCVSTPIAYDRPVNDLSPIVSEFDTVEQAEAHLRWLEAKVEASLADGRPTIEHDEAMERVARDHRGRTRGVTRLVWRAQALEDLETIIAYIAERNLPAAERLQAAIGAVRGDIDRASVRFPPRANRRDARGRGASELYRHLSCVRRNSRDRQRRPCAAALPLSGFAYLPTAQYHLAHFQWPRPIAAPDSRALSVGWAVGISPAFPEDSWAAPASSSLFELNEVPLRIYRHYAERHPRSAVAKLLAHGRRWETVSEDEGHLSPWVTWPTLHRGVPTAPIISRRWGRT